MSDEIPVVFDHTAKIERSREVISSIRRFVDQVNSCVEGVLTITLSLETETTTEVNTTELSLQYAAEETTDVVQLLTDELICREKRSVLRLIDDEESQ